MTAPLSGPEEAALLTELFGLALGGDTALHRRLVEALLGLAAAEAQCRGVGTAGSLGDKESRLSNIVAEAICGLKLMVSTPFLSAGSWWECSLGWAARRWKARCHLRDAQRLAHYQSGRKLLCLAALPAFVGGCAMPSGSETCTLPALEPYICCPVLQMSRPVCCQHISPDRWSAKHQQ